jgi:hypothetical protein
MKAGLIGHGYWGKILESKIKEHFDLQLIANSKTYYADKLNDLDWIFIATPCKTHYEIVKKCIESGKNVFCEKPFTLDFDKSNELFDLADKNNVSLYIDNLFLDRDEIRGLDIQDVSKINFIWFKSGGLKDTFVDALLYHDIYIMMRILNCYNSYVSDVSYNFNQNEFDLSFCYNGVDLGISYNVEYDGPKTKKIWVTNPQKVFNVNLSNPLNDPLDEIVGKIGVNKFVNYKYNRDVTLATESVIEKIKKAGNFQ